MGGGRRRAARSEVVGAGVGQVVWLAVGEREPT
jgi:hypothetical protein